MHAELLMEGAIYEKDWWKTEPMRLTENVPVPVQKSPAKYS